MEDFLTSPDFGAGLSLDELVGMTAQQIHTINLPQGEVYQAAGKAAALMVDNGFRFYMLEEIWADGHTVWHGLRRFDPVIVTPSGELIREQNLLT